MESLPQGAGEIQLADTLETRVKLQEEMVKRYLVAQEKSATMMLKVPKKLWQNYFAVMRQ